MTKTEFIDFISTNIRKDQLNDSDLDLIGVKLIYLLNEYILSGKYLIEDIYQDLNSKIEELSFALISVEQSEYGQVFRSLLNTYHLFVTKINKLYDNKTLQYIDVYIASESDNLFYTKYHQLYSLLNINIEISKIDHHFVDDQSLLKQLFRFKNDLKNNKLPLEFLFEKENLFSILKEALEIKINFLIDKLLARNTKVLLNQENELKFFTSIDNYSKKILNDYIRKIIYLYELKIYDYDAILNEEFNKIDKTNFKKINFFDLHTCIKYYKDYEGNIDKLKGIYITFQNFINVNSNNAYDQYSKKISLQYSINNYFSLLCDKFLDETNINNFEEIDGKLNKFLNEYDKCCAYSKSIYSDNFFVQYKFLNCILTYLEKLLEYSDQNFILIKTSTFFKNKIKTIFEEYEKKVEWSLLNSNYIFKLPYNESLISYKEEINIFFASTFLLPKSNDEIIINKKKIVELFQKLSFVYNAERQINEIKSLNEKFESDNKKLLETVTIFTAIISFIVGSISAFQFIESFFQSILFISIYAICISIFVLLIFIPNRGLEFLKNRILYLILPYITLSLLIYFIIFPNYLKDLEKLSLSNKNEKIIQSKLDSVQKININLIKNKDSLTLELINKVNNQDLILRNFKKPSE